MALRLLLVLSSFLIISIAWAVVAPDDDGPSLSSRRHTNPWRRNRHQAECAEHCKCSTEALVCKFTSHHNSIIKVPKTLKKIHLSGWSVERIEDDASFFTNATDLRSLTLTSGRLTTFPSVRDNRKLNYLDVSDNSIASLTSSSSSRFSNKSELTSLNVSGNSLTTIDPLFFRGLVHLVELDLSRNPRLVQIPSDSFASSSCCGNLRFLDVSFAGLIGPNVNWTVPLKRLMFLNVSHNQLTRMPPSSNLSSLRILDASYNPITELPTLWGLRNLTELYLSHTWIGRLDAQQTEGCNRLQIIDLSYANLTNVDENVLGHCKRLREIDLSHNYQLRRIEHGAFSGLVDLTVLRLNNCPRLNDLEEEMFKGLISLKELHLQDSGVKVLPSSLGHLTNLSFVNLEGTRLLCDCYAYWLPTLLNSTTHLSSWKGVDPIGCRDGSEKTLAELNLYHRELRCEGVSSYTEDSRWVLAPWGQSALLECNVTGNPDPIIVWLTMDGEVLVYNKSMMDDHPWTSHHINSILSLATAPTEGKFQVLQSGQLLIRKVERKDIGRYKCFAFNAVSNTSVIVFLGLKDTELRHLVLESILFGITCSALFLFVTLLTQFLNYAMERLGLECCCCRDRLSPKAKQIKQLIESVESYKSAQLERLKDNYNSQVLGIKEGCYCQMERLREGYTQQSRNLKDLREYSTQHLTGARDQYLDQVNKCRDYSLSQMNRVRENYVFQRQRIRKFSGHQLVRLRDTYKYQQKTLNKLLETLPDLYIQNCRTGSCQRTDSMIFEDEIDGLDIYYKLDFRDTSSFHSSDHYFTPCSTLTKKSKMKSHSRNDSSASGGTEYHEAHSWLLRHASNTSDKSMPKRSKIMHNRSFSIAATPPDVHRVSSFEIPEPKKAVKAHKRSMSASIYPSPQVYSSKPPLVEERADSPQTPSGTLSFKSSSDTPPILTPLLTPIHDKVTAMSVNLKMDTLSHGASVDTEIPLKNQNETIDSSKPVDVKQCEPTTASVEQKECQQTALS